MRRWLSEEAAPRLPQFFQLVQAITGRLPELVGELVPIAQVPSLSAQYAQLQAARRLAHEQPWTEAVLRILETQVGRDTTYQAEQISRSLGVDLDLVEQCLAQLVNAGIVDKETGHYRVVRALSVDTKALGQVKAHWCDVAKRRALAPQAGDVLCYNVLAASEADVERIRALLLATYRQIRSIVANTPSDEAAAIVNLQLIGWEPSEGNPSR